MSEVLRIIYYHLVDTNNSCQKRVYRINIAIKLVFLSEKI